MRNNVMAKAWEIAKQGVKKFGGKVKEYFAIALKMAWAQVKGGNEVVELKGTEKQVKWANDIREVYFKSIDAVKAEIEKHNKKGLDFSPFFASIENQENASEWISNFQALSYSDNEESTLAEIFENMTKNMIQNGDQTFKKILIRLCGAASRAKRTFNEKAEIEFLKKHGFEI
ncbi:hypothetical protein U3450_003889 [Bacillus cytotoxicus]|uniref:hypothetical protein n=1 Tax=unclassified Bacillus cereus group TaxID=2750818 RepID=UPI001F5AC52A|nr:MULTISPECIES: hypothetical protein [unclassified Bacillus cereus group]EMA6344833.1 hypothetical protein [Bacillus cytotoxicus]